MNRAEMMTRYDRFLDAIIAGDLVIIAELLNQGHSPNDDSGGIHPLDVAFGIGRPNVVSLLLERGASFDSPIEPSKKEFVLRYAVMQGNKEIVSLILQHIPVWDVTNTGGHLVLHWAMEFGREEKKEEKIIDILKIFLDLGANVDVRNFKGRTALFVAVEYRLTEVVKFLIENNADVNARDDHGLIPLYIIALHNYDDDIAKALIERGADVNARVSGKSMLYILAGGEARMMQIFVRAGARCDVIDESGYSPLYHALEFDNYDVAVCLMEVGADMEGVDIKLSTVSSLSHNQRFCHYLVKLENARLSSYIAEFFPPLVNFMRVNYQQFLGTTFNDDCQAEIAKMKNVHIDGERSLYDFVRLTVEGRISCLDSETLADVVKLSNLETTFPVYCDIIVGKYLRAVERKPLLEGAENALIQAIGFALPDVCLKNIFRRLNNQSLEAFI